MIVMEATRLPKRAASAGDPVTRRASDAPAEKLSPAPQMSTGLGIGFRRTRSGLEMCIRDRLSAGGLDAGKTWTISPAELRHLNANGVLSGLKITEGGADRCAGNATCGIDPAKPWTIQVVYNERWVTIASFSANKGVHVKFSPKITFDQWQKTANPDEREFGHGEGRHISSIKVNGSATSLCSGKGACAVELIYRTP